MKTIPVKVLALSAACAGFLLGGGPAMAKKTDTHPSLTPKPQVVQWLKGTGVVGEVTVEYYSSILSPQAQALFNKLSKSLPKKRLPQEGYLLQTQPKGAFLLAKDKHGEAYGRQTLAQLRLKGGRYPLARIADWPQQSWRGLHVLDSGPATLPQLKTWIHEVLAKNRCNILIYEIDYNYHFATHPEIKAEPTGTWTKDQVRELVQACRDEGIKVIPEINSLGHQSWQLPPGSLLKAHPEFEEPPDASTRWTDLKSKDFYCRSWCPLHPKLNQTVTDLMGELIDAFQADMYHCGMDEVFIIGSKKCSRCKGKDTSELFAGQVLAFHDYLQSKGVTMLMWGDRLLDSKATGYSEWDASLNGTAPAIDKVPKDIIICDWHYEYTPNVGFPSAKYFAEKGFQVWPTVYRDLKSSLKFMEIARGADNPNVLGTLGSIWQPAAKMMEALYPTPTPEPLKTTDKDKEKQEKRDSSQIAKTAVLDLQAMWNFKGVPMPK